MESAGNNLTPLHYHATQSHLPFNPSHSLIIYILVKTAFIFFCQCFKSKGERQEQLEQYRMKYMIRYKKLRTTTIAIAKLEEQNNIHKQQQRKDLCCYHIIENPDKLILSKITLSFWMYQYYFHRLYRVIHRVNEQKRTFQFS